MFYDKWMADRAFVLVPAQAMMGPVPAQTFEAFPPRQKPASFSIDDALERARERQKTMAAAAGSRAMQSTEGIEAAGGQPSVH